MNKRNLRNWLKAYMEFTAETESPAPYHFWTGVALVSAVSKRKVCLDMNMFKIFPNMYIILVGPSGGRKSVATGLGMEFADQCGIRKFSDKITGAALIKDLSGATEKSVETTTSINGDKGSVIQLCSPVMIYASELGVFMGADAYGSGVIADLTDLYDCPGKWEKKTIARDAETIMAPYVTFLAASTPQTLKDTIPIGAVGQGFTSRILFVWGGGRRKRVPIPTWGVGYEMLKNNLIADLVHIGTLAGNFAFTKGGFDLYKKHYMEHPEPEEEYEDERFRGYASRKDIHTLKLAQVISLSDRDDLTITEDDMKSAIDAIRWLDEGLPHIFEGHGAASNAQDVVRVFRQIEKESDRSGRISHSELLKRNFAHINTTEFGLVIQTLSDSNAIGEIVAKNPLTGKVEKFYQVTDRDFIKRAVGIIPKAARGD